MIAVFWAYDGWVYITWVAGEVKKPRPQCARWRWCLGVLAVGVIYMAMNMTYVYAMPMSEIAKHETIAHAAAVALFSPRAAVWLSAMIAISCFSAAATCTLSGARVYLAMAQDGVFFKRMAEIHPKWRTPAFGLIGQGIWAAVLAVSGRYDQLYTYVIYGMVLSYTLTVIGLFVLRWKRPDIPRPYRCAGYPWLPGIYVLIGTAWTLNTIIHPANRGILGNRDHADRRAGISVLETQQPEGRRNAVARAVVRIFTLLRLRDDVIPHVLARLLARMGLTPGHVLGGNQIAAAR